MKKARSKDKRRHLITGGVLVLLIAVGTLLYLRPLPALYPVSKISAQNLMATPLTWPGNAEAAVGATGYGLLASSSATQTQHPIASVAKLITALTVLQKYPLTVGEQGPTITLTATDVASYNQYVAEDGSVVPVQAGEQITEYQALQAMLLPSANNMADSLAVWAYGSLASYKTAAKQLVQTLGLSQTIVGSDASGFDPSTMSTTDDLVKLGEAVLAQPAIAQIVAQTQATLPVAGVVHNVNWLLGEDGIVGIKTGNSDQAGGAFVFGANDVISNQTVVIVGAVLSTPDLSTALDDAVQLLDSAKANFISTTVAKAGAVVASYKLPWGGTVNAVAQKDVTLVNWRGSSIQPALAAHAIYAPLAASSPVGSLSFTAGPQAASTPVTLQQSISRPPWWWRILRHKI